MSTSAHPVEITAPDISPYRGGSGDLEYVVQLHAEQAGPHVMISAIVHGNELCGAIVVDDLLRQGFRPRRGRLTLVFANPQAMARFKPAHPTVSRYVDEDLNRVWSEAVLDGPRSSSELRRARSLRPLVDEVDFLLDIHSMQYGSEPLVLCGPSRKGRDFACEIGFPHLVVSDIGHASGKRMRDYGRFNDASSPKNALLIECGEHWREETVAVAREMTQRFLLHLGLAEATDFGSPLPANGPQRVVEVTGPVTAQTSAFRFSQPYRGLEVIERAGTVIGHDGDTPVRTPYDECVLIMPSRRLTRGGTAVRFGRYVS